MKRLVLVRHGKSDWGDMTLQDIDRPLNGRGRKDAPRMARYLSERHIVPDLMISSPALRARETARAMADVFAYPEERLETAKSLYPGCPVTLEGAVDFTPEEVETLFVVAHNPGISHYASALTGSPLDLPTCGAVICEGEGGWTGFSVIRWEILMPKSLPPE